MKWEAVKKSIYKNSQTYLGDVYVFQVADIDGKVWQTSFNEASYATAKEAKQALDDLTCYTLSKKAA